MKLCKHCSELRRVVPFNYDPSKPLEGFQEFQCKSFGKSITTWGNDEL